MIIDSLKGLERYLTLHPNFKEIFQFVRENELKELAIGEHTIVENSVYCTIWKGEAKDIENEKLTSHDSHIAVNIVIEGDEIIAHKERGSCNSESALYDEKSDLVKFNEIAENFITLSPNNIAILFPHDAYASSLGGGTIHKATIKIKL